MDFLKNLKLEDSTHPEVKGHDQQDRGLLGKIGGALQSHSQSQSSYAQQTTTPQSGAPKHENILNKIGDALHKTSSSTSASPQAPAKEEGGLLGKIGKISNALGGEHKTTTSQPPPKQEGLLGKIGDVLGGEKKGDSAKPNSLGDKINHALGGGVAGEQKEDTLDKAIDFVQEHLLGAGPQNNESAVEQLKDKHIADAIKHQFKSATGKDFPGTKK